LAGCNTRRPWLDDEALGELARAADHPFFTLAKAVDITPGASRVVDIGADTLVIILISA